MKKESDMGGQLVTAKNNLLKPTRTTRFNIKKFYMVLALRWVFCTDLRTDSGFYNCGGKCLQRGTDC